MIYILIGIVVWVAIGTLIVFVNNKILSWAIHHKGYPYNQLIYAIVVSTKVIDTPFTIVFFPIVLMLAIIVFLFVLVTED